MRKSALIVSCQLSARRRDMPTRQRRVRRATQLASSASGLPRCDQGPKISCRTGLIFFPFFGHFIRRIGDRLSTTRLVLRFATLEKPRENRGFQSFGWHVYGQRKEGQKSAQSGLLGPSSAPALPRRPHGSGGGEDFSEPTECASARVAAGARFTACSAISRRRTTRLSEITACTGPNVKCDRGVIVEVRRGTFALCAGGECSQAGEADEASPAGRDAPSRRVAGANCQRTRSLFAGRPRSYSREP